MSRLETISAPFRDTLVAKNDYANNDQYNAGHDDALSTGDEAGKGLNGDQVGGLTDIKMRDTLAAKNKFNKNKEYNSSTA